MAVGRYVWIFPEVLEFLCLKLLYSKGFSHLMAACDSLATFTPS